MLVAELISESEAGALHEQILSKPESTAEEVIRQSGLLTEEQMQSMKLAEFLLASGTITDGQFLDFENGPDASDR